MSIVKCLPLDVFAENVESVVETLAENGTIGITKNGTAKAVVIAYADYFSMKETLAMLKLLAISHEDVVQGRVVPADETIAKMRLMIDEARNKNKAG